MKKSKFTEAQIIFAIKQSETGVKVEEVCRKMGISDVELLPLTRGKKISRFNESIKFDHMSSSVFDSFF